MMRHIQKVKSWGEFEATIGMIADNYESSSETPLLFRGHADADWPLATTLERRSKILNCRFEQYFRIIMRVKPEIETYSGKRWDDIKYDDVTRWTSTYEGFSHGYLLAYEYLAHLRHHGFPSPLLDWSRSPYVAAYFAFANAYKNDVAIYVYNENPYLVGSDDKPVIHVHGNYVRAPRRHFRQQSLYTTSALFDSTTGWQFVPHSLLLQSEKYNQYSLWKIILPAVLRESVMTTLDKYTLNAFSLFEDDNNLMETMAFREVDLRPLPAPGIPDFFKEAWDRFLSRYSNEQ
jgi:hypothetical protein